jgi:hypothetical protein
MGHRYKGFSVFKVCLPVRAINPNCARYKDFNATLKGILAISEIPYNESHVYSRTTQVQYWLARCVPRSVLPVCHVPILNSPQAPITGNVCMFAIRVSTGDLAQLASAGLWDYHEDDPPPLWIYH